MIDQKEYVVTLHDKQDLDQFYLDMETPGGSLYIPDRAVDLANRRPISRNTHYYLTAQEAEELKKDSRVRAVELLPKELGMTVRPMWTQSSDYWNKSSTNDSQHKNWGLLRSIEGQQRSSWGSNSTSNQTGTITANAQGRNVDVVIIDGHINPNHPEYAVNSDGTGGSRVVQYNWFQHDLGSGTGNYVYGPYTGTGAEADNNHGTHVAGTVAGNTQGWARSANIYNISPYSTDPNALSDLLLFDYIRAFHANKAVNPATGRKNPTICNNSWGYSYSLPISQITAVYHRGAFVGGPYDEATLISYGVENWAGYTDTLARYTALETDLEDAIADGIIMVGAAGNSYSKIDLPDGIDYNNFYIWSGFLVYYHRGGAPNSTPENICVGSIGSSSNDTKASYSMCGPRIDIYAPGTNIMSSFNSTASNGGTNDPRDSNYKIGKISGTSMASPQVTGVLACALEVFPNMTQEQAKNYIIAAAKTNQITDTGGSFSDYTSLQGSPNRFLYYKKERESSGQAWPKKSYFIRPSSGAVYPRTKVKRT